MALTLGVILHAFRGSSRAEAPGKPAVEAGSQPPAPCPNRRQIVEIRRSWDPNHPDPNFPDPRRALKTALETDCTTVLLGPQVDIDFTGVPDDFLPIIFGKQVTLTSVSGFIDNTTGGNTTIGHDRTRPTRALRDVTSTLARQARTPHSLGPVLRFGMQATADTLLLVNCEANKVAKDGARISGFRLFGPSFGQQSSDNYGIEIERCVDIDISNMEIAGWGGAGVEVVDDKGESENNGPGGRIMNSDQIKIHDCFFHHNQHPGGTFGGHSNGYGVVVSTGAWARISRNVFDFNRHSISASGDSGGYQAEQNLVLKGGGYNGALIKSYTHSFDVHGDANCPSSCRPFNCGQLWNCGNAGIQFSYFENAFQFRKDNAIEIRGRPAFNAYIAENVFPHPGLESSGSDDALDLETPENVTIGPGNVINFDSFGKYGVCDFDGDGVDDLFLPTGATWWFSSFGEFQWSYLNRKKETLDQVRLGYFDNDLRCDVLADHHGQWVISSGGTSDWRLLGAFGVPLSEVQFGQFDPNHRDHRPGVTRRTTDAFRRAPDGQWYVTPLSSPNWKPVQSSSFPMKQLRFGDFNGDGVTDVLAVNGGRWAISESATESWQRLNKNLGDAVEPLFIANMDADDNIDDILRLDRQVQPIQINGLSGVRVTLTWWRSKNGVDSWQRWQSYVFAYANSPEFVAPLLGFAGRFGAAPGGGTLVIDQNRLGNFYSEAEVAAHADPSWKGLFPY